MEIEYKNWIGKRNLQKDEFGEKICYCGHTDFCSCSNPTLTTFKESLERGAIKLNNKNI